MANPLLPPSLDISTLLIHSDDHHAQTSDVAPPIHLTTTFRNPRDPDALVPATEKQSPGVFEHVYSRFSAPNSTRLEIILESVLLAPSVTYSSGLSAVHALYCVIRPPRIFITAGYHGVHGVLRLLHRVAGDAVASFPLVEAEEKCGKGDVIHIETPINPTGHVTNIAHYARIAKERGAYVVVDATVGPPPLQEPFSLGADAVIHSGTKYIGGHSDMLLGVVATRNDQWRKQLLEDRVFLGSMPGNMEGWMGIRSLRTMTLRVERQARSAMAVVGWLDEAMRGDGPDAPVLRKVVHAVHHSTTQMRDHPEDAGWIQAQMSAGLHSPLFALVCTEESYARALPSHLVLWNHATSLGGVESLIEWRAMSDATVDRRLLRLSVGVEDPKDLYQDLLRAFHALAKPVDK